MKRIPTLPRVGYETWPTLLGLATHEVFVLMLDTELATATETFPQERIDITSMVGLAGEVCGILTVRSTAPAVALMTSKMLDGDADTDSQQTTLQQTTLQHTSSQQSWDAFGEICNMIAGNFKHKIAGMGNDCMLSVPTVITGADYNLHSRVESDKISVHLLFEGHPLIVALEIHH